MHGINYYNHGLLYVIHSDVRKYTMYEQCGEYIIHLYEFFGEIFISVSQRAQKGSIKTYISNLVCTTRF